MHRFLFVAGFVFPLTLISSASADTPRSLYLSTLEPTAENSAQFEELLTDGFNRRVPMEQFKTEVRQIQTQVADDPAVAYAYALSLIKRSDYEGGLAELKKIRGSGASAYMPAWRTALCLLLTRKQYDDAFRELDQFAAMLNDSSIKWNSPAVPLENSRWIGMLLAGLDLDLVGTKERALHLRAYVTIEEQSTPANRRAFQLGVDDALQRQAELESKLAAIRETAISDEQKNADLEQLELAEQQANVEKKKEELKLTAEEWKKKLDAALLDYAKKIGERQREFALVDARRQTIARTIENLQQQLVVLQAFAPPPSNTNGNFPSPTEQGYFNEVSLRQQQLVVYQNQQTATLAALEQIRIQGNQILAERSALIRDYQTATGKLVQQDRAIDKASRKFEERSEELKTGTPEGNTRETRKLEMQIRSFATYVAYDLESERQRLIDAHTPVSASPEETLP